EQVELVGEVHDLPAALEVHRDPGGVVERGREVEELREVAEAAKAREGLLQEVDADAALVEVDGVDVAPVDAEGHAAGEVRGGLEHERVALVDRDLREDV